MVSQDIQQSTNQTKIHLILLENRQHNGNIYNMNFSLILFPTNSLITLQRNIYHANDEWLMLKGTQNKNSYTKTH